MLKIPNSDDYWLNNARVPLSSLEGIDGSDLLAATEEGLCAIDLHVREGAIAEIVPSYDRSKDALSIDLKKK